MDFADGLLLIVFFVFINFHLGKISNNLSKIEKHLEVKKECILNSKTNN